MPKTTLSVKTKGMQYSVWLKLENGVQSVLLQCLQTVKGTQKQQMCLYVSLCVVRITMTQW